MSDEKKAIENKGENSGVIVSENNGTINNHVYVAERQLSKITLSETAIALILATANSFDGILIKIKTLGNYIIGPNGGRNFIHDKNDRREVAMVESAVEELVIAGFLKPIGKNEFEVTHEGFKYVDSMPSHRSQYET